MEERVTYEIDAEDRIVFVGDGWQHFAIAGDAPKLLTPDVIGHSLWEFIHGDMVESIYKQLLVGVRLGKTLVVPFRCDSPEQRRHLDLRVSPTGDRGIRFETITTMVEQRSVEEVYAVAELFSKYCIVSCSWCNKIRTGEKQWHEVEKAVSLLRLFDTPQAPQLSHGMCESCFENASKAIFTPT